MGRPFVWKTLICPMCKESFRTKPFMVKRGRQYCSRRCFQDTKENPSAIAIRFWSKVRTTDHCWIWIGNRKTNSSGRTYGGFKVKGKMRQAHRVSWEMHRGAIPAGLFVLHSCDNPPCVNPDHLFLGTQKDNALDRDRKGRREAPQGEKNGFAKLTSEKVEAIRREYQRGSSLFGLKALGIKYCVHSGTIWGIVHRKRWSHI